MNLDRVAIVGAGRVGLTLARALNRSGSAVTVLGRRVRPLPAPLGAVVLDWAPPIEAAGMVIVAVPDDAISDVSQKVFQTRAVADRHVVLHTSGLHDRSALAALDTSGAALGSWHPLQTFAPADGDTAALAGSPVVIEGDERALVAGRALAQRLHLRPAIEISASGKAAYHAAAVFASNYLVVLADIASRLASESGAGESSARLFLPLMRRTLANYEAGGAATLTGPISRGDAGTVARHLAALSGEERTLYVALGKQALRLARAAGLDEARARAVEALLY